MLSARPGGGRLDTLSPKTIRKRGKCCSRSSPPTPGPLHPQGIALFPGAGGGEVLGGRGAGFGPDGNRASCEIVCPNLASSFGGFPSPLSRPGGQRDPPWGWGQGGSSTLAHPNRWGGVPFFHLPRSVTEREVTGLGISRRGPIQSQHVAMATAMLPAHLRPHRFWAGHPKLGEPVGQSLAEKPTAERGGSKLPPGRGWINPSHA